MKNLTIPLSIIALSLMFNGCTSKRDDLSLSPSARDSEFPAVDHRQVVSPDEFKPATNQDQIFVTERIRPPFKYDELIYSWETQLDEGQGFHLFLKPVINNSFESPWLFAGYWGDVPEFTSKKSAIEFKDGKLFIDQLVTRIPAIGYQWKIVSVGSVPLTESDLPSMHIVTTNNDPSEELYGQFAPVYTTVYYEPVVHDLPLRYQAQSDGTPMPDTCQTAALATTFDYFGTEVTNEEIFPLIYDDAYEYKGVWPRITGTAAQYGYSARVDRFRDWQAVKAAITNNEILLASITMPKDGDYIAPPYESMGGHIFAINGWTEDGRVIVTDSALGENDKGYRSQWLMEDLEQVWMENKGGVTMVISPPKGFQPTLVTDLAPFPR